MSSYSDVLVSAWVKIGDTTSIEYDVFSAGEVEFTVGGRKGFMLVATEGGLQNFLVHAEEALRAVRDAIAQGDEDAIDAP